MSLTHFLLALISTKCMMGTSVLIACYSLNRLPHILLLMVLRPLSSLCWWLCFPWCQLSSTNSIQHVCVVVRQLQIPSSMFALWSGSDAAAGADRGHFWLLVIPLGAPQHILGASQKWLSAPILGGYAASLFLTEGTLSCTEKNRAKQEVRN